MGPCSAGRSSRLPSPRLRSSSSPSTSSRRSSTGCGRSPSIGFVVYPYLKRDHLAVPLLARRGRRARAARCLGGRSRTRCPGRPGCSGAAVAFWVTGFDVLYALFDLDVDRAAGAPLVPGPFRGQGRDVRSSAACATSRPSRCSSAAGLGLPVGALYWIGVAVVALLLGYEQSLVSPRDWRRLDTAFFTMNGVISLAFFAFVLGEVLV